MATFSIKLNSNLYLRDPQSSQLGQNIIQASVKMIEKNGFDAFTFKKLGEKIGSPEASIYRYFENKHRLLLYLIDWYWTWLEYRIDYSNQNVKNPVDRLKNAIRLIAEQKTSDPNIAFVDEEKLQRIVNSEFEKTYLTRQVDADNKEGLFLPYKLLCKKIAAIIREVNPNYGYPHALISTILLSANHQLYYASHLPSLTDIKEGSEQKYTELTHFLESLVLNTLNIKRK
jgi:AcrR family transcriptional regulator